FFFFFSSRRRHTRFDCDWSSDVCSSDLVAPDAQRALEIGCGDGSIADRVTRAYPHVVYLGIDVVPTAGRRYVGDPGRATFRSVRSEERRVGKECSLRMAAVADRRKTSGT